MENHIDRRVILCPESEYKNLYEWCLQEIDADGKKIGRDQIPWEWTLYFKATELTLHDTLTVGSLLPSASQDDINTVTVKQGISAKLLPFGATWSPSYSMFGTDRTITDISLSIMPSVVDGEQEQCLAWGIVSYTAEIDFREETTPDCIGFYLIVNPDRFAQYVEMIATSAVEDVLLFVGRVPGFYSDWSPSTSTDRIKILADKSAQKIEIPPGCKIDPPRLGRAQYAQVHIRRAAELSKATPKAPEGAADEIHDKESAEEQADRGHAAAAEDTEEWTDSGDASPEEDLADRIVQVQPDHRPPAADPQTVGLLSSIRIAAWVIAGLLLLILINLRL
ncbi:MAG: hypothetical protein EOR67_27815 [Mesorhizobium sp.]|uniref:hypothetical protein n=1 Tax=Mesorhizobium sp. TaxID=1871066 RepID=UPI000FEAA09F|nr:hypothetical protein [Mesorhizobium sp.]RWL82403.1 MAG: hypothetical protein EOR67_27815 [Mesorhizobium sp.]